MSDRRIRWTEAEHVALVDLAKRGLCIKAIARHLGKSYHCVNSHARYYRVEIQRERQGSAPEVATYIDSHGVNWRTMAWDRLAWSYGSARADHIMSGRDPKTQADLAAWRALGERRVA